MASVSDFAQQLSAYAIQNPAAIPLAVVSVLVVVWLLRRGQRQSSNVLRPVRAVDRAMTKRGLAFKSLVVTEIERLSHDTQRFRVALPSENDSLGRRGHMSIQATIDGERVVRPYTPITPPWQTGYFDLVIKRYDYGALTPYLFTLEVGDKVDVRGPFGGVKYEPNEVSQLLLLGAGSGLTPLLQIIRIALAKEDDETRLVLLYQNRNPEDILLKEHLEALSEESDRLVVGFYCSRASADWGENETAQFAGYIDKAVVSQHVEASATSKAIVCGPQGFNKAMKEMLTECDVDGIRTL